MQGHVKLRGEGKKGQNLFSLLDFEVKSSRLDGSYKHLVSINTCQPVLDSQDKYTSKTQHCLSSRNLDLSG